MRHKIKLPLVALSVVLALISLAYIAHAQSSANDPAKRYDASLFNALRWRSVGPNRGGRSIACAGSTTRPFKYYFGAVGGGLWKTNDGGLTWKPVTGGQLKSSSIGAVAVSESNPDVVFIGMGETELRGNIMQGDGVYKTSDAGKTWTQRWTRRHPCDLAHSRSSDKPGARLPAIREGVAMLNWQDLKAEGSAATLYRAKVPGGWLVLADWSGTGITFYPDPAHQ
jgi:hypothetical protein